MRVANRSCIGVLLKPCASSRKTDSRRETRMADFYAVTGVSRPEWDVRTRRSSSAELRSLKAGHEILFPTIATGIKAFD